MISANSNVSAFHAQGAMSTNSRGLARVMEQLSTGKRINSSADDVAGLAISTRLTSQIRGLNQAIRNGNDAISMLQTADSTAESVINLLQRMRELSIQYVNDTNNITDRALINLEFTNLKSEISTISRTANWNGIALFDGQGMDGKGNFNFQIGPNDERASIHIGTISPKPSKMNDNLFQISAEYSNQVNQYTQILVNDFNRDGNLDVGGSSILLLGKGDGTFQEPALPGFQPIPQAGNSRTQEYLTGDLNRDGKIDLILNQRIDRFYVALGRGDGTFQVSGETFGLQTTNEYWGEGVNVADFNKDGKLDLVSSNSSSSTTGIISVRLGNGNGTFQTAINTTIDHLTSTEQITPTDLNKDGKIDLIFNRTGGHYGWTAPMVYGWIDDGLGYGLSVLLGNGNGTFQNNPINLSADQGYNVVTSDVNNDGNLDILTSSNGSVSIFTGNGNGSFNENKILAGGIGNSKPLTVDLNADGFLDIAVQNGRDNSLSILLGNGDGTFRQEVKYSNGIKPYGNYDENYAGNLVVADFDGDGILDLADSKTRDNAVSVFKGNGDGTFQAETQYQVSATFADLQKIAVADLNKDGAPDIITSGQFVSNSILLNQSSQAEDLIISDTQTIDLYLDGVNSLRANIASASGNIASQLDNLDTSSLKFKESLSRIEDKDYSQATTELAKRNIIQQAAQAMLAQANQKPQVVLQLMKMFSNR